jgi:O-methyltransferase
VLDRAMTRAFRRLGFDVRRSASAGYYPPDFDAEAIETIKSVAGYTLTTPERVLALIHAVRYLCNAGIDGAVLECGVWKGGSMAAAALTFIKSGDVTRDLHLFDTFGGMAEPTETDIDFKGVKAADILRIERAAKCAATLEDATPILYETGYPRHKIHFVAGRVEETLPQHAPDAIALLRLDTDWYESTKHELLHLFPRLRRGGVLIIDDYGHWRGARQACDEYFEEHGVSILLNRVDYSCRMAIKL